MRLSSVVALLVAFSLQQSFLPVELIAQENDKRFVLRKGHPGIIVFIHGVTGTAEKTWFNENANTYWPRLMAEDPQLNVFDIYTASYWSPIATRAQSIEELTTQLEPN